jgi:hypothetical protein
MTLTTEYIRSRTAMAAQSEAWISEWVLTRMGPNKAEDIAGIVVSPDTLSPGVKEEAGIRAAATSSSRTSAPKPASKPKEPQKPDDKKPARKDSHKKPSVRHGAPSNPDSDPDSSDDDWDDDDSDSSGDDVPMHMSNQATLQDDTTVTFKQYVNSSTLEDFNEKASLAARRRWWGE